jgi:hypothetical protein
MGLESEVSIRSGTTADWAATTLVLGAGELGLNTTTGEIREGDGVSAWANLGSVGGRAGRATLVAGTKVVNDPSVTALSVITLTAQSLGTVTAPKALAVTARVAGTSFTITSADVTDTSVVGYTINEP